MTDALQKAMRLAESLTDDEQRAIAAIIEAEIADEAAWQERFAKSPKTLEMLVQRAKKQYASGEFGSFDAK